MVSRSHFQGFAVWIALIDLASLVFGSALAILLRLSQEDFAEYLSGHIHLWLIFFGSVILANYLAGSYRLQHSYSRFNVATTWLFSMFFAVLVMSVFSYAWLFKVLLGRGILFLSMAFYSVISLCLKVLAYRVLFTRSFFLCRTVIAGVGAKAREMQAVIENKYVLPVHKVIAFVDVVENKDAVNFGNTQVINGVAVIHCTVDTFEDIIRNMRANLVITAFDERQKEKGLYSYLRRLRFEGIEVMDTFAVIEAYVGKTPIELLDEDIMTRLVMESRLPMVRRVKRLLDIVFALLFLLLLFPVMLLVAVLIKICDLRGRIIYSQIRVGQFGRTFRIYKFRTMKEGAEFSTGPVW